MIREIELKGRTFRVHVTEQWQEDWISAAVPEAEEVVLLAAMALPLAVGNRLPLSSMPVRKCKGLKEMIESAAQSGQKGGE